MTKSQKCVILYTVHYPYTDKKKGNDFTMSGHFKRGYKPLAKEAKRQEELRQQRKERLYEFFLKDDRDEADVRFLLEEPCNIRIHQVQRRAANGKTYYENVICTEDNNCPYCEQGDNPTMKGATLVIDRRPYEYTDEKGKKRKAQNTVKLFIQGTKVMGQLERISEKYGLTDRDVTIIRLGTGTGTSYTIERGDEEPITTKEIKNALPDWCRDQYDGTEDSLYDILEDQLTKMLAKPDDYDSDYEEDEDDEEEEDERPRRGRVSKSSKSRSYIDDDEDDEDDDYDEVEDDDEEDDDEEPPRRRSHIKSSTKSVGLKKSKSRLSRR